MRLICPNCSAEYEVDASVIPETGRDVQCSNCAHTWFEPHPDQVRDTVAATSKPGDGQAAPRRSRVAAQRAARAEQPPAPATPPAPDPAPAAAEAAPRGPVTPTRVQPRREIDPEVLRVLREEAAHEERMRRGGAAAMESQEELALAGAAPRQSRRIPTDPRDLPDEDLVPSGTIGPRRDGGGRNGRREMLPDIEEINSSLRASTDRKTSVPAYVEVEEKLKKVRRGQGFRLGFSLMLMLAAAAMMAYVFAPEIGARFPQADPYMARYVTEVNAARGWLDTTVRALSDQIVALIAENS